MPIADSSCEPEVLSAEQIGLVRQHLKELAASHAFAGSKRTQDFLHLIVEHALQGEVDSLRERMIGAEMFGRPIGYDTGNDSVVRVKATDLRRKLAEYYLETREKSPVRIELPRGSYVPKFIFEPPDGADRQAEKTASALPAEQATAQISASVRASNSESPAAQPASHPRAARRWLASPRLLAGVGIGLALLAVAGYFGLRKWFGNSGAQAEIRSIAILPLTNLSGDPKQEYFADGMTEELINDLGQVSTLRVISLTSAMSYKGTKKNLPEIANELSVQGVVEGGVLRDGN